MIGPPAVSHLAPSTPPPRAEWRPETTEPSTGPFQGLRRPWRPATTWRPCRRGSTQHQQRSRGLPSALLRLFCWWASPGSGQRRWVRNLFSTLQRFSDTDLRFLPFGLWSHTQSLPFLSFQTTTQPYLPSPNTQLHFCLTSIILIDIRRVGQPWKYSLYLYCITSFRGCSNLVWGQMKSKCHDHKLWGLCIHLSTPSQTYNTVTSHVTVKIIHSNSFNFYPSLNTFQYIQIFYFPIYCQIYQRQSTYKDTFKLCICEFVCDTQNLQVCSSYFHNGIIYHIERYFHFHLYTFKK